METMPLDEMKNYQGSASKPEDFKQFWQAAKEKAIKEYEFQLKPCSLGLKDVDTYQLVISRADGSKIIAKAMFPKGKKKKPTIVHFHGYMGRSPDWSEGLKYLASDYAFVAMDVRGQAGKSIDRSQRSGNTAKGHIVRGMLQGPQELLFKEIYLDAFLLIEALSQLEEVGEIYSLGASQGGALALIAAALSNKVTKTVSIYPFLADFKRVIELRNQSEAYDELFRYFKLQDPLHTTENQVLQTLAYIDLINFADEVKNETLMVISLADTVCFPSTQFAVYNRLKGEKERVLLPEYGHEALNVLVNDLIYDYLTGTNFLNKKNT